jgi:hypothetical protein
VRTHFRSGAASLCGRGQDLTKRWADVDCSACIGRRHKTPDVIEPPKRVRSGKSRATPDEEE